MVCGAIFRSGPGWGAALGFTFAVTYAALLRPDGALVALAFASGAVGWMVGAGARSDTQSVSADGGWFACCWRVTAICGMDVAQLADVPGF